METDTAFVRADYVVVLDTVTHVCLDITFVVHPRYTEFKYTIRNTETLDEVCSVKLWVFVVLFLDCWKYLTYGLDVLWLVRKSLFEILYNFSCIHNFLFLVV